MQQSPELEDKIREIFELDYKGGIRIEDYLGNTGNLLFNKELVLISGILTNEELSVLQKEYNNFVHKVLGLTAEEILSKLDANKPLGTGSDENIELIKKAFEIV